MRKEFEREREREREGERRGRAIETEEELFPKVRKTLRGPAHRHFSLPFLVSHNRRGNPDFSPVSSRAPVFVLASKTTRLQPREPRDSD